MIREALSAVLRTEPVQATIVTIDSKGQERTRKRFTSLVISVTSKGYVVVGIDVENDTTLCTSSRSIDFRLTPLEAIQVLRSLDGMQVFTVVDTDPDGIEVEEINQVIKALRGELRGGSLEELAKKYWLSPIKLLQMIRRVPDEGEMTDLMERYSRDNGLAFFVSAHTVVMPYLRREGLVSLDELGWFSKLTFVINR